MKTPIRVGFVGAGGVTQTVHLPTLAGLDAFAVTAITDVDRDVADAVAARAGAAVVREVAEVAAAADVVCICSPDRFHADHVIAAAEAGARAILCEKPLVVDLADTRRITDALERTGVPLVVGAMHTVDPVWRAAWEAARERIGTVLGVDSSIVLPFNARFEREGAETIGAAVGGSRAPAPERPAERIRRRFLLLAIHDIPLARRALAPGGGVQTVGACELDPVGYSVLARSGEATVTFLGSMRNCWDPHWDFTVTGSRGELRVRFPPSFVQAGSATARLALGDETIVFERRPESGYAAEWRLLADIVRGDAPAPRLDDLVADVELAIGIADRAAALVAEGSR